MGRVRSELDAEVIQAWRHAAVDLGIVVRTPVGVENEVGVALVTQFGGPRGTIIVRHDDPRDAKLRRLAHEAGYFVSQIAAASYKTYDRDLFVSTLDDWGWFGHPVPPPAWYTERHWGSPETLRRTL